MRLKGDFRTMSNEKDIYIIGHTNPDTDSICSAIAYADLKRKITGKSYKARRAGQVSPETRFVLDYFGMHAPGYINDVRMQVKDTEYHKGVYVKSDISLKKAWATMNDNTVVTLPVVDQNDKLKGIITIGDIARSYMEVYDNHILANAKTSYKNIIETLEGTLVSGEADGYFDAGKVLIAAANPDLMENYIEENDLVILGNRYESQLCAIEMNAGCLVVCEGAAVSMTIRKLAEEKGCIIIQTPYDTFTVARLINQSMPIDFFMKKENIISFTTEDFIEDIREVMAKKRHRDFPVLDKDGVFCGMISRRNLLDAKPKRLILVDHNERSQAVDGLEDAEILEIVDHHKLGGIQTINPVMFRNQPLGCTCTIVYQMYKENHIEVPKDIAGLLCSAILSDTLVFRSPTCTEYDKVAAEELAKIAGIEIEAYAMDMFAAGSNLSYKSPEEIFYQDFKKFTAGELLFGVGQISCMSDKELETIKERLIPYLKKALSDHQVSMIFFMLTNILDSSSEILYEGEGSKELLDQAFKLDASNERVYLEGVVSRKKQMIPSLMLSLQDNA